MYTQGSLILTCVEKKTDEFIDELGTKNYLTETIF